MRSNYSFRELGSYIDALKPKIKLAVMYGGNKEKEGAAIYVTPNTRPWKSYESVAEDIAQTLRENGFDHVTTIPDDMEAPKRLVEEKIDLVWLNTGGMQGYNPLSHAPSLLEMLGLPYIGHNPLLVTLLDNKHCFKREMEGLGIPTAPFMVWDHSRGALRPETNFRFQRAFGIYRGPFVVKPISGRASLYVNIVEDMEMLPKYVSEVYEATRNNVLIERFIGGREFCVSVCGRIIHRDGQYIRTQGPFVFSEIERIYGEGERMFVSMDKRPITNKRARILDSSVARDISMIKQLHTLAQNVYLDLDLSMLIRLDVRADEYGNLFVLEANPKPDLAKLRDGIVSLVGMGLAARDMSYDDLILSLLATKLDSLFSTQRSGAAHVLSLIDS